MKTTVLLAACGIILGMVAVPDLSADLLQMQNGDRYNGKVLSVSAETVVLQNDVLGKVTLPRSKVANVIIGTNANVVAATTTTAPAATVFTNLPDAAAISALTKTGTNAASNAEVIKNIREKMLAGSPDAAAKYDELASGLMSGKLDVNDIRRQAQSSADQLRKLKRELGPEAGDSLDSYLEILDGFLNETTAGTTNRSSVLQPTTPGR